MAVVTRVECFSIQVFQYIYQFPIVYVTKNTSRNGKETSETCLVPVKADCGQPIISTSPRCAKKEV